jgi:hypothetical protein
MKSRLAWPAFIVLAIWSTACHAGENVQARFEKSLKDAKSISNVEIHWRDTLWIGDPAALKMLKAQEFSRTFDYSYIASGPEFRTTSKLVSGTKTNLVKMTEAAFDGKSYVTYMNDFRSMSEISDKTWPAGQSESDLNPLTVAFTFLSKDSDNCTRCLLRTGNILSDEFGKGLTLSATQNTDGLLEISMPGLPLGKQPTKWEIAMDEKGDAFTPQTIRFIAPGCKYEIIQNLLDYTNLEAYQFPSKIAWRTVSYPPTSPPTLLQTGLVTLVSARIPEQIADSVFRFDAEEKSAATVWDWDQHKLTKSSPALGKIQAVNRTTKLVLTFMILITTAAFVTIVAKRVTAGSKSV